MSVVEQLHHITKEFYESIVCKNVKKDERDGWIEALERFLQDRENLLANIQPPFTEEEKRLGAEIVQFNQKIDEKLKQVKQDIQLDIRNLKKTKESTNKYLNPYQSLSMDGMFYDKRK
jgi:flagellar protein FliT